MYQQKEEVAMMFLKIAFLLWGNKIFGTMLAIIVSMVPVQKPTPFTLAGYGSEIFEKEFFLYAGTYYEPAEKYVGFAADDK